MWVRLMPACNQIKQHLKAVGRLQVAVYTAIGSLLAGQLGIACNVDAVVQSREGVFKKPNEGLPDCLPYPASIP